MTRARPRSGLHGLVLVWLALVASGCAANLGAVRDFASTSSDAAQYTQLIGTYVSTPTRLMRYEPESQRPVLARQAAERTAQQEPLLLRQRLIQSYMDGLGQLAADGLATYNTQLDGLGRALQAAQFTDQSEAAALAAVSKQLANAATERWRRDKLVTLIEQSDAPFQVVVGALVTIVETGFVADLANEREAVNKYYTELQLRSRDPAGLAALGEWRDMREAQIRDREAAIGSYVVVLKTIGSGHHKLYESRHQLSHVDVQAQVHQYTSRLREAVNAIRSFH